MGGSARWILAVFATSLDASAQSAPAPEAVAPTAAESRAPEIVYVTPAGAEVPPPPNTAPPTAPARDPLPGEGLYAALSLGVSGPFGASSAAALHEGFGTDVAAGFGFGWFAVGAVVHYGRTALAFASGVPEEGSGSIILAALEARVLVNAARPVSGWAALGIGLGGGVVEDVPASREYELNVGPSPVLGFGAMFDLGGGFRVGPTARWWVLRVTKVCQVQTALGNDDRECVAASEGESSPDLAFLGVSLSYAAR